MMAGEMDDTSDTTDISDTFDTSDEISRRFYRGKLCILLCLLLLLWARINTIPFYLDGTERDLQVTIFSKIFSSPKKSGVQ